ncbi:UNKNOWN [Stylonychia lemnae]|uniref:Amidase domain-containing protein n=1 Tax=Stylonychia lemnae TaxID=5949 RepID=A0A078ALR2_STYLE|nr:UNKNOWN [Stylonychia lemnae]|eukprot:CDW82816.1 UNKNOWN [Stylonychia lemnae]
MQNLLNKDISGHKLSDVAKYSAVTIAALTAARYIYWKVKVNQNRKKGLALREKKLTKTYTFKKIENEELILSLDVTGLREHLKQGTFTSVDLVHVFGARTYKYGRDYNLTTEELIDEAFQEADEKDQERKEALRNEVVDLLPPLHGIPISVQDIFQIKGTSCSGGCEHKAGNVETEDGMFIQFLKQKGGIVLTKANQPQTRTCGGSSGGDAGLVAARAVPFAFGTDLAGSGRVPPLFCGIASLKPTNQRTSLIGVEMGLPMLPSIPMRGCPSAFGKTVQDVVIGTKFFFNPLMHRIDLTQLSTPWNESLYQRGLSGKIKIGYCDSLPTTPAMASIKRAIHEAKQALEEQGYELVPIEFSAAEVKEASEIMLSMVSHYMTPLVYYTLWANYEENLDNNSLNTSIVGSNFLYFYLWKLWLNITGNKRLADSYQQSRPKSRMAMEYVLFNRIMNQFKMDGRCLKN